MKFRQYIPAMPPKTRTAIINAGNTPYYADGQTEALARAEEIHAHNRRPFYRVYPGIMIPLLRIGIEKINISKVQLPVNGLALEFAEGHFLRVDHLEIVNLLIVEFDEEVLFVGFVHADGKHGQVVFSRKNESIFDWSQTTPQVERDLLTQIMIIVFGVCMIPHADTDLIKPLVLNRDKEKFEATGDMKFVDRAKRNGVHGWELGRDIPTPEEMEIFRQQHGEPGRKSPHWRMGHFAIRHTGEGRTIPVIRWINETFVNKDLWKKVPHGYHDDESGTSEESRQE
jgi:hypothetical protein